MTPAEWNRLLSAVGKRKNKKGWKALLGDAFQPFEPCLRKTGDHVRAVGCDLCACNHEVFPDKDGNGFVAHCRCDDRGCADILLTRQDAEAWEFCGTAFGETLGRALGVTSGSVVRDEGKGLFDIGECPRHPEQAHVWFCACPERLLAERLTALLQRKSVGCVVVPSGEAAMRNLADGAGVAVLSACECLGFNKSETVGKCGEKCQTLKSRRPVTQGHFDERVDTLGQEYGATKVENMRLKTELAKNILTVVKKADPEFIRDVLCVLAAGSVSKASKKRGMANSTFSEKLKQHAKDNAIHQAMYRMIDARKNGCGVKSIERFNEEWDKHQGDAGVDSFEDLLKAIVEGLEAMNPTNFIGVKDELMRLCAPFL